MRWLLNIFDDDDDDDLSGRVSDTLFVVQNSHEQLNDCCEYIDTM